ncbi:MAG TPA: archaeosortase/exosortase family protein [Pyrinomonadaceae bacterium]|jgi:exosortase/archaeosortase family protein
MNRAVVIIALQLLAFWPVWRWYTARVTNSADDMWSVLALATVVLLLLWRKEKLTNVTKTDLLLPTLLLILYAITYPFFPPLLRAVVAMTALGSTISLLRFGKPLHLGTLGLLYLSLPLIPTLQFYGGYPLRVFVAGVAAPLLRLGGFAVIQDGACLNWDGQLIWIDAPCSGVRMLWVGLYLTCTLACLYRLRFGKTLLALAVAFCAIILGNVFRSVALFYLEARVIEMPSWTHDFAGVLAFAIVSAGIVAAIHRIRKEKLCDAQLST